MEDEKNGRKKSRISDEMDSDRLSNLPDSLIYHILSLMDTKYAVRTCILSKKWTNHWTHVHSLNFNHRSFNRNFSFEKFIRHILRQRKPLNLCRLSFQSYSTSSSVENRIVNYAKSRRVEELETNSTDLCSSISKLQTLSCIKVCNSQITKSFNLASLNTLQLSEVGIYSDDDNVDFFSGCSNLENLFLNGCRVDKNIFKISAPRLVNLSISSSKYCAIPKIKLVLSTPRLKFFNFSGKYVQVSCIGKFPALDEVNIYMCPPYVRAGTKISKQECILDVLRVAEILHNAKSLKISWNCTKVSIFSDNFE